MFTFENYDLTLSVKRGGEGGFLFWSYKLGCVKKKGSSIWSLVQNYFTLTELYGHSVYEYYKYVHTWVMIRDCSLNKIVFVNTNRLHDGTHETIVHITIKYWQFWICEQTKKSFVNTKVSCVGRRTTHTSPSHQVKKVIFPSILPEQLDIYFKN